MIELLAKGDLNADIEDPEAMDQAAAKMQAMQRGRNAVCALQPTAPVSPAVSPAA